MPFAVFRADAAPEIGGGHVMRCLTLAGELQRRGWRIGFAAGEASLATVPMLGDGTVALASLADEERGDPGALRRCWPDGPDVLLVDHYDLDGCYEQGCRPWARKIVAIDDGPWRSHQCDLLVDGNLGRLPEDYGGLVPETCTVLCGPEYALLRPEFAERRQRVPATCRDPERHRRILIAFGMTDPENASGLALEAIAESGIAAVVDVVLGPAAPHCDTVRSQAEIMSLPVTVHDDMPSMVELMADADLAIGAGGTGSWERCCLGLPTVVVTIAENQDHVAKMLSERGAVLLAGRLGEVTGAALAASIGGLAGDAERLEAMADAASRVSDGRGAMRIASRLALPTARDGSPIHLEIAGRQHRDTMLAWQQDPSVRRYFRNSAAPTPEQHQRWLEARLSDKNCFLNVVYKGSEPAGTVRLDRMPDIDASPRYEVSILVAPACQGQGIGRAALALARQLVPEAIFHAEVSPENDASTRLFTAAGYRPAGAGLFVNPPTPRSPVTIP